MLVLKHVTKEFAGSEVLSDVSFRVDPKEFVCITGPSGAGKSTLLHLLIGAEEATKGTIEIDGVDLRKVPPTAMQLYRRRVGVVFQDGKLLQHRTVEENVAFPLEVCGLPPAVIHKRVPLLLKYVGLLGKRRSLPRQLSGGEKTRVAIARAIVHQPMVLLADEPTANLDPEQSRAVLQLLRDINASGTTVLLATHDSALVDELQTRVLRLERGKVVRDGAGTYAEPASKHETATSQATSSILAEDVLSARKADSAQKKIKITAIGSM